MKHRLPSSGKPNDKDRQENQSAKPRPKENEATAHRRSRLFELSIDILSITELDGSILDVNPAFERIFQFTTKEVQSKFITQFVHPDDRKIVLDSIKELIKGQDVRYECRGLCKDGSYKRISWTAQVSPEEGLIYYVGHDLTKSIENENRAEIQRKSDKEEHASQMEAMGAKVTDTARIKNEFLANVSHELRTPLTLLLLPLESYLHGEYGNLTKTQEGVLRTAHNNSLRLLQIVNGILDFSGYATGHVEVKRECIDVTSITQGMLADFQPLFQKQGLKSTFQPPDSKAFVMMDRYMYERILFNLLSNAVKFTKKGGVNVSIGFDGDRFHLSVADTGIGIDEEDFKSLFHKFVQLESSSTRRFEGLGLGLALGREFANLLEGDISVQSKKGIGSTFTFHCLAPVCINLAQTSLSQKTSGLIQRENSSKGLEANETIPDETLPKVLVAEDNLELAIYINTFLHGLYQTKLTANGKEALKIAREWFPDLILSNIMMPEMDGLEFCKAIKSDPDLAMTPFVLLTALTHREALLKGWEAGADEYLFKPFHSTELLTRIKSMISARQEYKTINQMKTDFVAFAAHQLKTPEAEIKAYVDNLLDGLMGQLTGEQKEQLVKIKEINTANIRLVAELLNVSKLERGQMVCEVTPIALKQLVERAAQDYIALIQGKGLHFQAGDGKKIIVLADAPKAVEAIKNTLDNAMRFTDRGSIAIKIKDENNAGIIEVADTGPGIPNHILSKLFSKELVLDNPRPRGGSGLGLYIAKSFMKLQGGDLTVSTVVGEGSTFTFKFPKPEKEEG